MCGGKGRHARVDASRDKTVRVWDSASGICPHVLKGHEAGANSVTPLEVRHAAHPLRVSPQHARANTACHIPHPHHRVLRRRCQLPTGAHAAARPLCKTRNRARAGARRNRAAKDVSLYRQLGARGATHKLVCGAVVHGTRGLARGGPGDAHVGGRIDVATQRRGGGGRRGPGEGGVSQGACPVPWWRWGGKTHLIKICCGAQAAASATREDILTQGCAKTWRRVANLVSLPWPPGGYKNLRK